MEQQRSRADHLASLAEALRRGDPSPQNTVREFLGLWGAQRRGYWIVQSIRSDLKRAGLETVPDFESVYIDAVVSFRLAAVADVSGMPEPTPVIEQVQVPPPDERESRSLAATYADPTYRLSKLVAANNQPVYVAPDAPFREAVTIMMVNRFSQLPVMTTERVVKGVVSWRTLGSRLALGQTPRIVQDAMERAVEINSDASIFAALPVIVEHDYVLVRAADQRVVGIVTTSDISVQFQQLAEPFLLLGEIENHMRRIISACFGKEDFAAARDSSDAERQVATAADLTFGNYRRLLEEPARWERTRMPIDRSVFVDLLDRVRNIRNDVMHFDPDGIPPADLAVLRDFAAFLSALQNLGIA